ncbi:MAG: DUF6531 domain-containing protein [Opitutaceae bacterium]
MPGEAYVFGGYFDSASGYFDGLEVTGQRLDLLTQADLTALSDLAAVLSRLSAVDPTLGAAARLQFGTLDGTDPDPETPGNPDCATRTSMPVDVATGNKLLFEADFRAAGEFPLYLKRTYNKAWPGIGIFGRKWSSNFDYKLSFEYEAGSRICYREPGFEPECPEGVVTGVKAWGPDGAGYTFEQISATRWEDTKPTSIAWLERLPDGRWALHTERHTVETYDNTGVIQSIVNDHGVGWTFEYAYPFILQRVRHSSGRVVSFTWQDGRVKTVTDPAGNVFTYNYTSLQYRPTDLTLDRAWFLTSVVYPSVPQVVRTYHWDNETATGDFTTQAIAGISVNGVRISEYSYYGTTIKRAGVASSGYVGGVDRSTFVYDVNADGTAYTTVTNALGAVARYDFVKINDVKKVRKISRSGVTNCPNAQSDFTYDANGFVDMQTDWKGVQTDLDYNAKGQLQKMTLAANQPSQRRIKRCAANHLMRT